MSEYSKAGKESLTGCWNNFNCGVLEQKLICKFGRSEVFGVGPRPNASYLVFSSQYWLFLFFSPTVWVLRFNLLMKTFGHQELEVLWKCDGHGQDKLQCLIFFSLLIFCFREDPPSHAQGGSDDAEEIQVGVKCKLMSRLLRKIQIYNFFCIMSVCRESFTEIIVMWKLPWKM